MAVRHLSQTELAARWNISHRTLERWRWTGEGPQFIKIGGRVVYRQEDVEAFEAEQTRKSTAAAERRRQGRNELVRPKPHDRDRPVRLAEQTCRKTRSNITAASSSAIPTASAASSTAGRVQVARVVGRRKNIVHRVSGAWRKRSANWRSQVRQEELAGS